MAGVERGNAREKGAPQGAGPSEQRVPPEIRVPGEPDGNRNTARPGVENPIEADDPSGLTRDLEHTEKPDRRYR